MGDFTVDYLCTINFTKLRLINTLLNLKLNLLVEEITPAKSKACLDHMWSSHTLCELIIQKPKINISKYLRDIKTLNK